MSDTHDLAIETTGLTKRFGDFIAVDDLDLTIRTGEIFGFLGPNGAGKSTTIRILLDQLRASDGSAQVLGGDSRTDSIDIRRRIGYIPGDLALYPKMTGRATIDYFAKLRGDVDPAYVDELAERLQADLSKKVGDYSTGNRQKVGLIQAFMHRPELLILDEPNAGLDPLVQQTFQEMLREVRDEGRTVFLSSHTLSEVERVADRVGIIRHGKLMVVERIETLKHKAISTLLFEFAEDVSTGLFDGVAGVQEFEVEGAHATVSYTGPVNDVLAAAMRHEVVALHSRDSDLEEIFLTYYRDTDEDDTGAAAATRMAPGAATSGRARDLSASEEPRTTGRSTRARGASHVR